MNMSVAVSDQVGWRRARAYLHICLCTHLCTKLWGYLYTCLVPVCTHMSVQMPVRISVHVRGMQVRPVGDTKSDGAGLDRVYTHDTPHACAHVCSHDCTPICTQVCTGLHRHVHFHVCTHVYTHVRTGGLSEPHRVGVVPGSSLPMHMSLRMSAHLETRIYE